MKYMKQWFERHSTSGNKQGLLQGEKRHALGFGYVLRLRVFRKRDPWQRPRDSLSRKTLLRGQDSQGSKSLLQNTREERAAQRAPEMSKVFPLKSSKHLKNLPRQKEELPGLPWWSSGQDFMLSMQGMQV